FNIKIYLQFLDHYRFSIILSSFSLRFWDDKTLVDTVPLNLLHLDFQAKKMNVESLRSGQKEGQSSAEVRIAKTAITLCALFVASWTPYAVVALTGAFGDQSLLTPGLTMIPACTCKAVACLDPYVYAISHPRYRLELSKRIPCLGIKEKEPEKETASAQTEATTPH
ncbi:opsin Rh4-like, partial [Diaphorina citri]|uniref:Opsin Rh4-like n=1 Tax=Diaphorina citri TaxID=121845 RepID=A0A3Q0JEB8_DIACI